MSKLENDILKVAKATRPEADFDFLEEDEDHRNAKDLLQADIQPDKDYSWLIDYSERLWDSYTKVFSTIDEKSDSIIKYLGGGTGIFTLGIIAKTDASNYFLIWWCLPSLISSLIAIFLAVCARRPRGVPSLPPISQAKRYAEMYQDAKEAQAAFVAQWNLACVDMKLICRRKADFLELATWFYFAAISFLGLPLLVAAIVFKP